MPLILNIVINLFNKQENFSLGFLPCIVSILSDVSEETSLEFLIYLLYLNNCSFNHTMFLVFVPRTLNFRLHLC